MTKITSRTTIVPDAESDNKIMIMIAERGRFWVVAEILILTAQKQRFRAVHFIFAE